MLHDIVCHHLLLVMSVCTEESISEKPISFDIINSNSKVHNPMYVRINGMYVCSYKVSMVDLAYCCNPLIRIYGKVKGYITGALLV